VKVKDFLKENKIDYVEHNVAEDAKALQDMEEKSGQRGVPVLGAGVYHPRVRPFRPDGDQERQDRG